MTIYKLSNCTQELYYSNLKLLCDTHGLSYRSVYDKIRTRKEPHYVKGNDIVSEHILTMGKHKKKNKHLGNTSLSLVV